MSFQAPPYVPPSSFQVSPVPSAVVRSISTSSDRGRPGCFSPMVRTPARSESPSFMRATASYGDNLTPRGAERMVSAPLPYPQPQPPTFAFQNQCFSSTSASGSWQRQLAEAQRHQGPFGMGQPVIITGQPVPAQAVGPAPSVMPTQSYVPPGNYAFQPQVQPQVQPQAVPGVQGPPPSPPNVASLTVPMTVQARPVERPPGSGQASPVPVTYIRASQYTDVAVEEQLKEARASLDLRGKTILELEMVNLELQQQLRYKDKRIETLMATIDELQERLRNQPIVQAQSPLKQQEDKNITSESPRVSAPSSPISPSASLGDDEIDFQVKTYLKEHPDWAIEVHKIRPGWYHFGRPVGKRVFMKVSGRGTVVVRTGGGYKGLRKYLDEQRIEAMGDDRGQAKRHWGTMRAAARVIGATGQKMYEARSSTDAV